ncbi:hypothetical protein O181_083326, partial [Austropuccinia psidii MF-1]|nr:hypothetical protein [Austropuccinia psidii MF-1]
MAFLGHLDPLQPLQSVLSLGCRPIGPLLAYSNEAKRGQRGQPSSPQGQVGPKPQLDPPEPKFSTNPLDPKLAKELLDTNLTINPIGPIFGHGPISQPWPLETTRGHQISSAWCIYGIIYHYEPFLRSNSMVTFSGPNSTIQYQGLKIQHPSPRMIIQLISLTCYGGNQKTLQGSQPPVSAGVGLVHYSGLFKRENSHEVLHQFNQSSRHQVFQNSLDNSIHPYRPHSINLYGLGSIRTFHIPLCEFHHTVQISRRPELYFLIRTMQSIDSPSRISLSVFPIYWSPFSTWGLFPQLINILDLFLSLFSFTLL